MPDRYSRLEGRNGEIWRLYCRGASQDKLAERFNLSQQRISQIINETRDAIPEQQRRDVVKREIDFLEMTREEVMALWDEVAAPLVSNGRVIDGVKDHSGRLAAIKAAEALTARLHRVLGIDAPAKVDLTLQGEEESARRAAAEAIAHLHGGDDDDS